MKISLLKLLSPLIVCIVLALGGLFLRTYLYVRALPKINDPESFAKALAPTDSGNESMFKFRCNSFTIAHCTTGGYYSSPLFPPFGRRPLKITLLQGTCERSCSNGSEDMIIQGPARYLYTDPLWHVFWIVVDTDLGGSNDGEVFGPYRLTTR